MFQQIALNSGASLLSQLFRRQTLYNVANNGQTGPLPGVRGGKYYAGCNLAVA